VLSAKLVRTSGTRFTENLPKDGVGRFSKQ